MRLLGAVSLIAIAVIIGATSLISVPNDEAVYELRSYHIEPAQLDNYITWISTHGLPHIRKNMDVVGFWVEDELEAEINGAPMDEMGPANVSWVIKWESKEARDKTMGEVFGTETWQEIFAKFPGGREAYKRVEVRYLKGI